MRKIMIACLVLVNTLLGTAQESLNGYKYVVVPEKFDFLKSEDLYQFNSLTKFLLNKEGFVAFLEGELPEEAVYNPCMVLRANVLNDSNMFTTKMKVTLSNCYNQVLFTSEEGRSKEKDYQKAYHEALRDAFQSFKTIKYSYNETISKSKPEQIKIVKEVPIQSVAVVPSEEAVVMTEHTLYAQPTATGFQLVDMSPKLVMKLYRTSVKDVFIAEKDGMNGLFYRSGNEWYFEYYEADQLKKYSISVKF